MHHRIKYFQFFQVFKIQHVLIYKFSIQMDELAKTIVKYILTATIGAFFGHRLALGRDRRDRILEFNRKTGELLVKFKRQKADSVYDLYSRTVPETGGLINLVRRDVRFYRRRRFNRIAEQFCALTSESVSFPMKDPSGASPFTEYDFERGRLLILSLLRELMELAS